MTKRRSTENLKPWDRIPGETRRAFAAFTDYCRMGPGRSVWKLYDHYREMRRLRLESLGSEDGPKADPPTQRHRTMVEWSSKYNWVARSQAWDTEQARIRAEAEEQALLDMYQRHIGLAITAQERVAEKLSSASGGLMSTAEAARLLEVATRLERESRGVEKDPELRVIIEYPDEQDDPERLVEKGPGVGGFVDDDLI